MPENTLIDWWIITRETVFIFFYLGILTYILLGNRVELIWAVILVVIYIVHIFLMKYSNKYEVALKHALANSLERTELTKIANQDISRFHMNLRSQAVSIEMLNKVRFKLKNNYIILEESYIRKKLKMSNCIKRGEEVFADADDKALSARRQWKEAVQQIIIKLQAYKHNLQIRRTFDAKIPNLSQKIIPFVEAKDKEDRDAAVRAINYDNYEAFERDSMEDYLGDSYASSDQLSGVSEESDAIEENSLEQSEDNAASGERADKVDDSKGMIYPTSALPPPSVMESNRGSARSREGSLSAEEYVRTIGYDSMEEFKSRFD